MKRFITVIALCVMTFWGSNTLMARGFGITGGASFMGIRETNTSMTTGYHAGITYKFDLPFGFAIQPSVLYHVKGSLVEAPIVGQNVYDVLKTGYVEVPVSFQWGPDLILFRPFLDVTPFVGYGLNNEVAGYEMNDWSDLQRLEYGLGVGLGFDIWKLQFVGRYNWNLGQLSTLTKNLPELGDANFGGVTLSVSFLF
jgi:hypothetical protein